MNSNDIMDYVKKNSYLDFGGWGKNELTFTTRNHGNVCDEEHSDIDYREAIRVRDLLKNKFMTFITHTEVFPVDEWVYLIITISEVKGEQLCIYK